MSENTGNGYGTGSADDRANKAIGRAEGLRMVVTAMMRAIAAGRTGNNLCAQVAADLKIEAQQREVVAKSAPSLETQATFLELKYFADTFKNFSAQQDKAQ